MHHKLDLTYEEYSKKNFSLLNTLIDKYLVYKSIGSGSYGDVYIALNNEERTIVAVKSINLKAINSDKCSERVKNIRRRLARTQSQIMFSLNSPHIMKCYDVYESPELKIMVMDYCNGGTLAQLLYRQGAFVEEQAINYIKQILFGLAEMHQKNIVHRDLKTDNIMLHNGIIKIIDLGFSKMLDEEGLTETPLGTITTMAPEIITRQKYGLKADIWSIGVIFYEMIYGVLPYPPMKPNQMYESMLSKNIFPNDGKRKGIRPSNQALDFMKQIFVIDQHKRIDWKGLVSHKIFADKENLPDNFQISKNISDITVIDESGLRSETDFLNTIETYERKQITSPTVRIKKMHPNEVKELRTKIEEDPVEWIKENYLQCLKTEFILKNLINPIEKYELLQLNSRTNTQFLYLLSSRCFKNMSFINQKAKYKNDELVEGLKETVQYLYKEVKKKFNKYDKLLEKQENKITSMFFDRLSSVFNSDEKSKKENFLNGLQCLEYKKEEHIKFTAEKYIPEILKRLEGKDPRMIRILENYERINLLGVKDLEHKKFTEYIQEFIG